MLKSVRLRFGSDADSCEAPRAALRRASFIPDELAQTIFKGESEYHLWLLISKGIFSTERGPWGGDAQDLKETLCANECVMRESARKLMGGVHLSTIGGWLRQLKDKFPNRIEKSRTAKERIWIIQPPAQ